ncbi:MAG TPA: hypothetical protein VLQ79_10565 [Myxococcaceae bacterium]|nr:hypothetical protein [Myxococcaceae bacterium]
MTPRFFPYRPTRLRALLTGLAVLGAALATTTSVRSGRSRPLEAARGAAGLVLGGGFAWLAWRLRPRPGYGVRVDLAGAELARVLDGRPERVLWPQLAGVSQIGRWAPRWVLTLTDGSRRELPRALFSDRAVFADVGRALTRPGAGRAGDA